MSTNAPLEILHNFFIPNETGRCLARLMGRRYECANRHLLIGLKLKCYKV